MPSKAEKELIEVDGREVAISNPSKVLFPQAGHTKLDLVRYYLAVAEGALRGAGHRPNVLVRYPNGVGSEFFYQKRAPESRPPWVEVVSLKFPSGRTAEEVVPRDAATLAWMANLACLELHPHPVRADDLDHPDELRVDLDPMPGMEWPQLQEVAAVVKSVIDDFGLIGWPKTSGSRGIHVIVRIEQRWGFDEVRRAALALAREVERRAPGIATSKWWKEERHGVFIDYNQNAKDRTVASAYSVRARPDARVSAPLTWAEIAECEPGDFTLATMPSRVKAVGDRHDGIDAAVCSLEQLLELSDRQAGEGATDAPWPPHYKKQEGEPDRVAPSRKRKPSATGTARAGRRSASAEHAADETDGAAAGTARVSRRGPGAGRVSSEAGGSAAGATADEATSANATSVSSSATGDLDDAPAPARVRRGGAARVSKMPLIEIGRAQAKDEVLAGLERWRARHPDAAALLEPADTLVDSMRGRSTVWWRIRVNLQHVPVEARPPQEALDPDDPPKEWKAWMEAMARGDVPPRRPSRARKPS